MHFAHASLSLLNKNMLNIFIKTFRQSLQTGIPWCFVTEEPRWKPKTPRAYKPTGNYETHNEKTQNFES